MRDLGIYMHIPFCKRKCAYCDFISFSDKTELIEKYVLALEKEIDKCNINKDNYKEFYEMAKERIDKAKYQDKLNNESYNSTASYNEYYITCLPWTDFISMTHPIPEDKSSQTVPRVCWGKYIENNGKYEISLNITVSHVFVDGYHLSKVFNNVQELLNDTTNVLK